MKYSLTLCLALLLAIPPSFSQVKLNPAPDRRADEGEGPFERLIIRGAIVMREDELLARPIGRPIRFIDTLQGE